MLRFLVSIQRFGPYCIPLSDVFSGPSVDGGIAYLACYYPFVANCQYSLFTGDLLQDADEMYCLRCPIAPYQCPPYDSANYPLGDAVMINNPTFCAYPRPQQPLVNNHFCSYDRTNGAFLYGVNPDSSSVAPAPGFLCPPSAVAAAPPVLGCDFFNHDTAKGFEHSHCDKIYEHRVCQSDHIAQFACAELELARDGDSNYVHVDVPAFVTDVPRSGIRRALANLQLAFDTAVC